MFFYVAVGGHAQQHTPPFGEPPSKFDDDDVDDDADGRNHLVVIVRSFVHSFIRFVSFPKSVLRSGV